MNDIIQQLMKLQCLQLQRGSATAIAELRRTIPDPILAHYDRLVQRGKQGVAVVQNQVCSGCHMRLPIGTINTLKQGRDIQLCDMCGRYLYLPGPLEAQFLEKVRATNPKRKPRSSKALPHAA